MTALLTTLCNDNLGNLNQGVLTPQYDRSKTKIGVVHFGPGAFHRAHQAFYFDRLLSKDPNYAIAEVSLHSPKVKAALLPQDYLYTIAQIDRDETFQIIGSIKEVLIAPDAQKNVIELLARPEVKLITTTITEKGYYLDSENNLDWSQIEISHDLNNPNEPKSIYGFIIAGIKARKSAGLKNFTIIACDNLANNGKVFRKALFEFASKAAPDLLDFLDGLQCPCTMVDSITPATDDKLRETCAQAIGLKDNWPIAREAFTQWVIEDYEGSADTPWHEIGVNITNDITQYESAKLRILNGAHSSLAYFGLLRGHKSVFEAVQDIAIKNYIQALVFKEIIPLLRADFPLENYANSIIKRFDNPKINHQLSQIAWDGSKKMPVRIFASIIEAAQNGREFENLAFSVACWIAFIAHAAKRGEVIIDPFEPQLVQIGLSLSGGADDVEKFISTINIFGAEFINNKKIMGAIKGAYKIAMNQGSINNA